MTHLYSNFLFRASKMGGCFSGCARQGSVILPGDVGMSSFGVCSGGSIVHGGVYTMNHLRPRGHCRSLVRTVGVMARGRPRMRLSVCKSNELHAMLRQRIDRLSLRGGVAFRNEYSSLLRGCERRGVFILSDRFRKVPGILVRTVTDNYTYISAGYSFNPSRLVRGKGGNFLMSIRSCGTVTRGVYRLLSGRCLYGGVTELILSVEEARGVSGVKGVFVGCVRTLWAGCVNSWGVRVGVLRVVPRLSSNNTRHFAMSLYGRLTRRGSMALMILRSLGGKRTFCLPRMSSGIGIISVGGHVNLSLLLPCELCELTEAIGPSIVRARLEDVICSFLIVLYFRGSTGYFRAVRDSTGERTKVCIDY